MNKYDPDKDKLIQEIGSFETNGSELIVAIRKYDQGAEKIAMNRMGGTWMRAIGRLSYDELPRVLELLQKAYDWMQDNI